MGFRRPRVYLAFFLFVLLFLTLRMANILTAVERISWVEELCAGTMAKELIAGLKLPLSYYLETTYGTEDLIVGIVALPFFKILGPSLFALKMAPFLFSLFTLVLLFFFMNRHFGAQSAFVASSLFVICPPSFVQLSLLTVIGHSESLLLSVAALFSFYEFLYGTRRKVFFLMLFGLFAGFGFGFYHATAVLTLTCLASWFFLSPRSFLSREFVFFLVFFLIGLIPWFIFNTNRSYEEFQFLLSAFGGNQGAIPFSALKRAIQLILLAIPSSYLFFPLFVIPGRVLSYLYCLIVLLIAVPFIFRQSARIVLRRYDPHKVLPLVLYPLLFIWVYSASSFFIPDAPPPFKVFSYFTPLQFFSFPLLAVALVHCRRKWMFLGALLLLAFIGQGALLFS